MAEESQRIQIEPAKTAFVVVDMQNDYCSPGGDFDQRGISVEPSQRVIPNIRQLIEGSRLRGLFVLYTAMVFDEFTYEDRHHKIIPERMRDRRLCRRGTWGAEIVDELVPLGDELIVEKCRFSAFFNTNLEVLLRNRGITTLILSGVVTNVCVESTARDAWNYDFDVILVSDGTASYSKELHEATLKSMAYHCGVVMSKEEVLELIKLGK